MSFVYETPIKCVIFDNDGTLMNTEWVYSVAHKILVGQELDWGLKVKLMGKTPIEACRITCEALNLKMSPEEYCEKRTKIVEEYWPTIPLMPGAEKVVDECMKRGIKRAIATASVRSGFNLKASGHLDFIAKMDFIVTADQVKNGKPAPDLFLEALHKFPGFKPEEALVFEDSPLGIEAANVAGMPSVFIPDPNMDYKKALEDQGAKPTLIIPSLEEFDFSKWHWAN